jgi:hypothetical protein
VVPEQKVGKEWFQFLKNTAQKKYKQERHGSNNASSLPMRMPWREN